MGCNGSARLYYIPGFFLDFLIKIRVSGVMIPVATAIIAFVFRFFLAVPLNESNSVRSKNNDMII